MEKLPPLRLKKVANNIRKEVISMIYKAGSGHPAGSLGITDVLTALYFNIMTHDPKKPGWEDRDRLFLSNGHVCPALYATLAYTGYFPTDKLRTLRKLGSPLQGHPEREKLPGLESTSGPLGEGLAQAAGCAYAARMDDKRFRVFCITSDGEHDEGNHWEAVMFAGKYKLGNLTVFVDRNNIQLSGKTRDIMPLEPMIEKYRAFNWNVFEINGNNLDEILNAVERARAEYEKPTVIIAKTISGKGVSFMEGKWEWHGKAPNEKEAEEALSELRKLGRKIT